jgi:hypothetical protein
MSIDDGLVSLLLLINISTFNHIKVICLKSKRIA